MNGNKSKLVNWIFINEEDEIKYVNGDNQNGKGPKIFFVCDMNEDVKDALHIINHHHHYKIIKQFIKTLKYKKLQYGGLCKREILFLPPFVRRDVNGPGGERSRLSHILREKW